MEIEIPIIEKDKDDKSQYFIDLEDMDIDIDLDNEKVNNSDFYRKIEAASDGKSFSTFRELRKLIQEFLFTQ